MTLDTRQLIEDLKDDEGWRSHVYQDTEGWWTIGYGFLVDERRRSGGVPREIGEYWLAYLVNQTVARLIPHVPWLHKQPEPVQRALVNMAYQLGPAGLAGFRKMLAAIKAGDYERAADEALDSRWARQTPNRAKRVSDLIRSCQK